MTCRELDGFLADYVGGDLPEDCRSRFEEHLTVCPECVRYLQQYRDTIRFSRAAVLSADLPVPDEVPSRLVDAILAVRRSR